jgi:hypothetical protein
MKSPRASEVSARIASLIERHHRGNRLAAAEQLHLAPETLAGLLSGDWQRFTLDGLAAVVCRYRVSVPWLLGSTVGADAAVAASRVSGPSDVRRAARTIKHV